MMDFCEHEPDSSDREKSFYGVRVFKDQLEDLDWLIVHKYHSNRTRADLCRDALDEFIAREKNAAK